jgi:hypothetical protein
MIPWAGGAGIGHLHPEHAVQAELHDLYKNIGGFRETFLRSRFVISFLIPIKFRSIESKRGIRIAMKNLTINLKKYEKS